MDVLLKRWGYDTGTCQQLELAVMYAECFNEAEATVKMGLRRMKRTCEEVTVMPTKRKKNMPENVRRIWKDGFPSDAESVISTPQKKNFWNSWGLDTAS